jgi:hypothetical protein
VGPKGEAGEPGIVGRPGVPGIKGEMGLKVGGSDLEQNQLAVKSTKNRRSTLIFGPLHHKRISVVTFKFPLYIVLSFTIQLSLFLFFTGLNGTARPRWKTRPAGACRAKRFSGPKGRSLYHFQCYLCFLYLSSMICRVIIRTTTESTIWCPPRIPPPLSFPLQRMCSIVPQDRWACRVHQAEMVDLAEMVKWE